MKVELAAASGAESLFGKFVLLRSITKGGMGLLSVAYDTVYSRIVVLKRRRLERGGNAATRFQDEIRIGQKLSHPNLVKTLETGSIEGEEFLSLEWIDGQDALALVERCNEQKREIPHAIAIAIVLQICDALAYAHGIEDFVHRDITPANIMLGYDGQARLVDYGLASSNLKEARTLAGHAVGTVGFLAPEQREGRTADPRADIYSVGATLQFLLTGVPQVTEGEDDASKDTMRRRLARFGDVPEPLLEVLWRALQRDPAKRYASAADFAQALRLALPGLTATAQEVTAFLGDLFAKEQGVSRKEITAWHARFGATGAIPRGNAEPTMTLTAADVEGRAARPVSSARSGIVVVAIGGVLAVIVAVGVLKFMDRTTTTTVPPSAPVLAPSVPAPAPAPAPAPNAPEVTPIEPVTVSPLPSPPTKPRPVPSAPIVSPPSTAAKPTPTVAATPTPLPSPSLSPDEVKRKIAEALELAKRGQARVAAERLEELGAEPNAVLALADLALDQGQYPKAIQLATKAAKLGAGTEALYVRGSAELLAGQPSDAARDFRKVLAAKPDHPDAQQGLARAEKMLSPQTP